MEKISNETKLSELYEYSKLYGSCDAFDGGLIKKLNIKFYHSIPKEACKLIFNYISSACQEHASFSYVLNGLPIAYGRYNLNFLVDNQEENCTLIFFEQ